MGPASTQILADHGADVVKIEPPEGDVMRHAGARREAGMSAMFLHINRGKRSVVLDLKIPEQRELLLERICNFDIVIHNMRREAVRRLDMDYQTVARLHPSVIYVELSGYGRDGPYADRPAYDDIIQAQTGIASLLGKDSPDGPRYLPALIVDRMAGVNAAQEMLAAICRRERSGQGTYLNLAMFETMARFVLSDHLGGKSFDPECGPMGYSRLLTPHRRPYRTLDGHIAVVIYTDRHWSSFFNIIARPQMFRQDGRFSSAAARADNYDAIYGFLAEILSGRESDFWLDVLSQADIPCSPVNDFGALFDDPHLAQTGFFRMYEDDNGKMVRLMPPREARPPCLSLPPRLGQHTDQFLAEKPMMGLKQGMEQQ
jgi:crotonobetainyl-CoA:carnitine CoA-transferase CaiB-like acyl-CoA transferase